MKRIISVSIVVILVLVASTIYADVIHFKSGRKMEGKIIEETKDKITLKTDYATLTFDRSRIASIEYKPYVIKKKKEILPEKTTVTSKKEPRAQPLEFRVLLIVKAKGNITAKGFPDVRYEMGKADIAAVKVAFEEYTPHFVDSLSHKRVVWKPTVVVSDRPLTSVAKLGEETWVAPQDVAKDIEQHAKRGEYDGIFVYWKSSDDESEKDLRGGFGWSIGPGNDANGCGYSSVNYAPTDLWTRESETTEVFIHEWLHHLEAFYGARGVPQPKGGLHGNDNYGFEHEDGWKHWYEAFINADLEEQDGHRVGLGEEAWRQGTIREEAAILLFEYLTADRRDKNLLKNGSFEDNAAKNWAARSWRNNRDAVGFSDKEARSGKQSVSIHSTQADDIHFAQRIAVKPNTRYLLCGWIKTKDVAVVEKGGKMGACLSILGGFESSPSTVGTTDWTYAALVFASGERKEIEVAARLGHHSSTATGTAWFDDLCLVEIGEIRPSGTGK